MKDLEPSSCLKCMVEFFDNPFLQKEMLHMAKILSKDDAKREFNERYEEIHMEHEES